MKKYRDEAAQMASERLSRMGAKGNEPDSIKKRAEDIAPIAPPHVKRGGGIKMHGTKAHKRLDHHTPHRADGGRVGKKSGKTTVNVIVAGQQPQPQAVPRPVPVPVPAGGPPPMPPRPPMAPPMGGLPPGAGMMPPGGVPVAPGAAPPGGLPLRKRGGAIKHHHMTAGAGSGIGRLQKLGEKPKPPTRQGIVNGI